jgi:tetratricopeptide (TPR) repeat protein
MCLRIQQCVLAMVAMLLFGVSTLATRAEAQSESEDRVEDKADSENRGQDKLDEASSLKLGADSLADLAKVIELCEEAMEEGLDEDNTQLAKQILAASAFQRAQLRVQRLPSVANNPNAVRRLRRETLEDLEKAIENNPELADALILMAKLETLPGGERQNAVEHLNRAIRLLEGKPVDQSKAYMLRAGLRESNDEKLSDLKKAIEVDPTNNDAWQAKLALQMSTGKLEEAIADAEALLEQDEDNLFAFEVAIRSMLDLRKIDEAIQLLSKQIDKDDENGALYRWRGRANMMNDDKEKALADLNKALELNKRDAEALLMRGRIYLFQDEIEKANRDISDSLLIEPDSVEGVLLRSLIAAEEERYSDAIADMELLVRADPSNRSWIMQLSSYYQLDDRPRLSIRLLDELLRDRPDDWQALRLRGDAKLSIGEHVAAVKDYQQAIDALEKERSEEDADDEEANSQYSGLLNNLSWVLSTSPNDKVRDGERALELALKACEVTDYEASHILSTLAAAYAEMGDFEEARQWAKKAVDRAKEQEAETPGSDYQSEQLQQELESYQEEKPWREEQEVDENRAPVTSATETIDT